MKHSVLTLSLVAATMSMPLCMSADDIANKYPGYKLAFQEEFNVDGAVDTDVWRAEEGFVRNHENQYYNGFNNTEIKNGCLVITAREEAVKNKDYQRYSSDWKRKDQYSTYTSSSIVLKKGYYQGIWEVRAKLPSYLGCWPAIWSTGGAGEWPYYGEIDIMEYYPSGGKEALHANVAWGSWERWKAQWASKVKYYSSLPDDFRDNFHTWKMVWTDESIKLYVDDILINEVMLSRTVNPNVNQDWYNRVDYNPYRDENNGQNLFLNLALGGDNGGSISNTPFPCEYLIDYVRIYTPDPTGGGEPGGGEPGTPLPTPYNLVQNGDFEDTNFSTTVPYYWMPDYTTIDGNLPGWTLQCDVWNVAASIREPEVDDKYIFDGNTQHLRMQRYEKNGWEDGTATQIVTGLTAGEEYCLDALVRWMYGNSGSSDKSHGFRICSSDGSSIGDAIYTNKNAGTTSGWELVERKFTPATSAIAVQFFISNPWQGGDGATVNEDVWLDVDNVRLYKSADYAEFHPTSAVTDIATTPDNDYVTGVYNLQGIRVADNVEAARDRGVRGVCIVTRAGGLSSKFRF